MRIHLIAQPNIQTTRAYSLDGFAMATIRFATMMKKIGYTVILYASEDNEAPCDELVTCITKKEIKAMLGTTEYQHVWIDSMNPLWQIANVRMIKEIGKRKKPGDFLCTIGGESQMPVAKCHPDLTCVEYSIGYSGSFAPYRVFESSAWRHNTYGFQHNDDGGMGDAVIPLGFDPNEFKFRDQKEPFALYVGRIIPRKGIAIACAAAIKAKIPLKLVGHGTKENIDSLVTHGGQFLGALNMERRNELMSKAQVVLCPTTYVEPFNCVAVEAQMCGTPVVSTDYGGFVETVEEGKTGFRCNHLEEFVNGIKGAKYLDHAYIRKRAIENYSLDAVANQYRKYFERISIMRSAS